MADYSKGLETTFGPPPPPSEVAPPAGCAAEQQPWEEGSAGPGHKASRRARAPLPEERPRQKMDKDPERPLSDTDAELGRQTHASRHAFVRFGIPAVAAAFGIAALLALGFLIKAALGSYFFCSRSLRFVPLPLLCDGQVDCTWGEDEGGCVEQVPEGSPPGVRLAQEGSGLQVRSQESGAWAWACHQGFDLAMAQAACTQMGYSSVPSFGAVAVRDNHELPLQDVALRGGELRWSESGRGCPSGLAVALTCSSCGLSLRAPRVVGGAPASIRMWPWQSSLQHKGLHVCGGTLIGPRWVLTAAHCFRNHRVAEEWQVKGGSETLLRATAVPVERIFVMEAQDALPKDKDIALVKLQRPLRGPEPMVPICLPFFDEEITPGTSLWVTGWGFTKQDGQLSKGLQQAEVKLMDGEACNRVEGYQGEVTESMLCAGHPEGKADACQGDSGGPLMREWRGQWHLLGVVSWGRGCGGPGAPGIYTKVQAYLGWIYAILRSES